MKTTTTTTTTREAGLKFKENKYALYCTVQCYLEKYFVHQQDSSFPDVRLGGHKLVENKGGRIYQYTRGTYHRHGELKLETVV